MHITDQIGYLFLKNSICDLIRFLRISHFSICFDSWNYGYQDFQASCLFFYADQLYSTFSESM